MKLFLHFTTDVFKETGVRLGRRNREDEREEKGKREEGRGKDRMEGKDEDKREGMKKGGGGRGRRKEGGRVKACPYYTMNVHSTWIQSVFTPEFTVHIGSICIQTGLSESTSICSPV